MGVRGTDLDRALSRLQAVLLPRVGKRATQQVVGNFLRSIEVGGSAATASLLQSIAQTIDAYARIPESGTPFPLDIAKAIGDAGCPTLANLSWRVRWNWKDGHALEMSDATARGVAQHADALLPAYGDDDAELAVRVAWRCSHQYLLHLVVGQCFNRNVPDATDMLFAAWERHGRPDHCAPIGVVPAAVGAPGVVYAVGDATPELLVRFRARGFVFSPDQGDNIALDDVDGLQRFFSRVPLDITPRTLAWICHLVRMATQAPLALDDDRLLDEWESQEESPPSNAASVLLGIPAPPVDTRDHVVIRAGDRRLTYRKGELHL